MTSILENMFSKDNPNNVKDYYDCFSCDCSKEKSKSIQGCSIFLCLVLGVLVLLTFSYFISFGLTYIYYTYTTPDKEICGKNNINACYNQALFPFFVLLGIVVANFLLFILCYSCFECFTCCIRFKRSYDNSKQDMDIETQPLI